MTWLALPAHRRWLETETDRLLDFGRGAVRPDGGFAWLDDRGRPENERPRELWINARMTHVFALGHLLGRPGCGPVADIGVAALTGPFQDHENGGWWARIDDSGPVVDDKTAYEHAFVVLAASSAVAAGRPGAGELLDRALAVLLDRFWDDDAGMLVEQWDRSFAVLDDYRGLNSNMHGVEALLAAADVTGDRSLHARAARVVERAYGFARDNDWRLPEHFDADWRPLLDYHHDQPAHPFRPYGATLGHSFEWARLGLQVRAGYDAPAPDSPDWLLDGAVSLFATGVREGWSVDGADGFVYTVGWDGRPVVRERMHWVAAEAVAAAYALWSATSDPAYAVLYETFWDHIATSFVDRVGGSWWHELDPGLQPAAGTWSGKPDVYHAVQATLIPRLPLAPSLATALREGRLD